MCRSEDGDVGAEQDAVANSNEAAVQNRKAIEHQGHTTISWSVSSLFPFRKGFDLLEVCVEVVAHADITPIVHIERRLDERSFTDIANDALEHHVPIGLERLCRRIVREVGIVFIHKSTSTKATLEELRR